MLWWVSVAPLGKPVVPLVYWMLIGSSKSSSAIRARRARRRSAPAAGELLPLGGVEEDRALERRQAAARTSLDHRDEVGALALRRGDDPAAPRLAERVLELGRPVRGVDVDEDHAELRGRVLDERPLGAVRAPDADPVALAQPGGEHPAREPVDRLVRTRRTCSARPGGTRRALGVGDARDRPLEVLRRSSPRAAAPWHAPWA